MRGSIKQRSKRSWTLRFDGGYVVDPNTGRPRRRQVCVTFQGTKRDAQNHLTELLRAQNRGELVEKSKLTVGEWLTEWLEKAVKPPAKRINTYRTYKRIITKKLVPSLGAIRLQELKAVDLKHYYVAGGHAFIDDPLPVSHADFVGAEGGHA